MAIYHATDTGAPVLSSNTGSVIGVLEGCLCIGYNGKSSAGWSIPFFSGTDRAVFRNGTNSHNRFFQINDNLVGSENFATIYGYESMTALDVGNNRFPSTIQAPNGSWIVKSYLINGLIKNWIVLANSKICYLIISPDDTTVFDNGSVTVFGDFISYNNAIDFYKTLLIYRNINNSANTHDNFFTNTCAISSVLDNHVAVRSYTGLGGSKTLGKHYDTNKADILFPNPIDGSLAMSPIHITEIGVLRGYLPGIWMMCPNRSNFQHGDVFEGTGGLSNKLFEICKIKNKCLALEISDTW